MAKTEKQAPKEPAFRDIINYAKNKYTTKNYTELVESYQLVLPLSLEGLISKDESFRLLSHELEENYTK